MALVYMSIIRFLITSTFCLLVTGNCFSQVSFVTKTSATKIGKNETLEVSYEVTNGTIDNFYNPAFKYWQIEGGPNESSSTFITNGEKTTSMSYDFMLKPLSTGVLIVPGATAIIDGKQVTSKPVAVTVTKNNKEGNNTQNGSSSIDPFFLMPPDVPALEDVYQGNDAYLLKEGEDILAKTKKNLFVTVDVSKKTCYPGEAIKASYQLYSRVNLDAHITKRPSFSGFSSVDLPDASQREYDIQTLNGKEFKVYPIRTVQLYPLLTGVQTLQPVEIETTVQYQKIPAETSLLPYNPYSAGNLINYPYTVKSEPIAVTVLPFPDTGKPADFKGVTGHFDIHAKAGEQKLALSEAGTLRIEINGSGNWAMVQEPVISWPQGVDVFEPVTTESIDSQAVPLTGRRIYEYPFSSNKAGKLTIPSINISYFDPEKKRYFTNRTDPITITILNQAKPVNKIPADNYGGLSGVDNTQIFTDIVKIAFPIAAVLLLLWLIIKNRRKNEFNRQEELYKKQYANKAPKQNTVLKQEPVSEFSAYQPKPRNYDVSNSNYTNENSFNRNDLLVEKTMLINEHAGMPVTTSKAYFSIVKKDLQRLLQQHFKIEEQELPVTKNSLLQHGFTTEETNRVIDLLELCERHIYSPFSENFDQPACNEMVTEVTTILRNKKLGKG